jgi:hypothetical protein
MHERGRSGRARGRRRGGRHDYQGIFTDGAGGSSNSRRGLDGVDVATIGRYFDLMAVVGVEG